MSYLSSSHTVNDVLNYVKRQFGDEAAIQISDADIIRWVNAGQDEIFRLNEPVKSSVTANLVAGQGTYTFPDGILRVQSIYVNGLPVEYKSTQEAEEYILQYDQSGVQTDIPQVWYEWGGSFTLYPTPNANLTNGIKFNYIKAPTPVTSGANSLSIPDVYYNRLIEYVLQQAYELDENFNAADMKAAQFSQNMQGYGNKDEIKFNTYPTITVLEEDQY